MYTQVCRVLGARPSKGVFQNPEQPSADPIAYDYTEVFIEEALDPASGGVGYAGAVYRWGKSTNIEALRSAGINRPFNAEVDFLPTTNGKGGNKIVITAIRPLPAK